MRRWGRKWGCQWKHKWRHKWGLVLLCWLPLAQAALPAYLQEALTKAQLPLESVAIVVQPLEGGAPLIQHNANQTMNPASAMKLVTTYAALEALTPAYRWKTEIYRTGNLNQGVLEGDLIVKGSGDPALNMPELWQLLQQVQQQGIRVIKGNLILDTSAYAPEVSQRPVLDDEPWRAYNANPSALLLNGRYTSFRFSVQNNSGKASVNIAQEFELPQIRIINQMQPRKAPCNDWREALHYTVSTSSEGATVNFTGTLPDQCDVRYLELSILSDSQYFAYSFKQLWTQLGGEWEGQVLAQTNQTSLPATVNLVSTWWSPSLDSVIRDINKWSNNVMARQLLLTLGVEAGMMPVDETSAALALKNTLRKRGLQFPELVIENGAGLSRQERISAEHLAKLLATAYQRPVMPVLMASLPILGLDGTTKKRLAEAESKGMAYLKTGSLEGVSSLAGYVQDKQGKRYVLVIIANHAHAANIRSVQDGLLRKLIEGGL